MRIEAVVDADLDDGRTAKERNYPADVTCRFLMLECDAHPTSDTWRKKRCRLSVNVKPDASRSGKGLPDRSATTARAAREQQVSIRRAFNSSPRDKALAASGDGKIGAQKR